ncbi:hypothetical protein GCM10018952_44340 [Streptosporangium vulgare]
MPNRPTWLCRIRHRVGVRGEFLLALALVDIGQCYRLMFPSAETLASPTNQSLASWMPLPVWGAVWGVVGLLCLVQAFMASDRIAFAAASFLKVGWALANLAVCAWGVSQAWWSVVIWLVFARIVHVFAKVPEQPDPAASPTPTGGAP